MGTVEVRFYRDHKCVHSLIFETNFIPRVGEDIWYNSNYYTVESIAYEPYKKDPALEDKSAVGLDVYIKAVL
jgi:hypothetical protein